MNEDQTTQRSVSLAVPNTVIIGVAALALLALTWYLRFGSEDSSSSQSSGGSNLGRKIGLTALIALIENDLTRKALVAALKVIARRS